MELEAIKPTHGSFAPASDGLEDFVAVDPAVVANHQGGGIHESQSGVLAAAGVQVDAHRH